jgi:microcystin degradation protein MlrC
LIAWTQLAGLTVPLAYKSLREELLNDLQPAMLVDIMWLNLHGAMVTEGYDDCEEDLTRPVRDIGGPATVIGVELDLHCHLSELTTADADIIVI